MDLAGLLKRHFPELPPDDSKRLSDFHQLVLETAIPRGLVGFAPEAISVEICRSLLVARLLGPQDRVIDVGTGAGFPGIPLAIALGRAWLVESRRKSVTFLERVVRELEIRAIVVEERAEVAARGDLRELGTVVTARALAPLPQALALMAPFCAQSGRVIVTAKPNSTDSPPPGIEGLGLSNFRTEILQEDLDLTQTVHIMDKFREGSDGPAS